MQNYLEGWIDGQIVQNQEGWIDGVELSGAMDRWCRIIWRDGQIVQNHLEGQMDSIELSEGVDR